MSYGLRIQRLPKAEIDARVRAAAGILELEPFLDRKPRALSGGQRQRVAMGRAIVREPDVFLFDEPLSNLDAKLRTQMRVEIKRLQQRLATTSLYVTHDQVEAMTLADRLMVMRDGVAEQIGTPMEVYANPASTFVGGFIGSPAMNFVAGRIDEAGRVALPGGLALPAAGPAAAAAGRPVTLGLRPEHLAPAAEGARHVLTLTVDLAEALGADTLVHGRMAGTDTALIARLAGHVQARPGERMPLAVAEGAWHLFDRDSGRRLAPPDRLAKPAA
jgi:sn-glycerol 3-phosphate transport system ATP-binding protein